MEKTYSLIKLTVESVCDNLQQHYFRGKEKVKKDFRILQNMKCKGGEPGLMSVRQTLLKPSSQENTRPAAEKADSRRTPSSMTPKELNRIVRKEAKHKTRIVKTATPSGDQPHPSPPNVEGNNTKTQDVENNAVTYTSSPPYTSPATADSQTTASTDRPAPLISSATDTDSPASGGIHAISGKTMTEEKKEEGAEQEGDGNNGNVADGRERLAADSEDSGSVTGDRETRPEEGAQVNTGLRRPKYKLIHQDVTDISEMTEDNCHSLPSESLIPKKYRIEIELPGIKRAIDIDTDIKDTNVEVVVTGQYSLSLPLPRAIVPHLASAKFNRSTSVLNLLLPLRKIPRPSANKLLSALPATADYGSKDHSNVGETAHEEAVCRAGSIKDCSPNPLEDQSQGMHSNTDKEPSPTLENTKETDDQGIAGHGIRRCDNPESVAPGDSMPEEDNGQQHHTSEATKPLDKQEDYEEELSNPPHVAAPDAEQVETATGGVTDPQSTWQKDAISSEDHQKAAFSLDESRQASTAGESSCAEVTSHDGARGDRGAHDEQAVSHEHARNAVTHNSAGTITDGSATAAAAPTGTSTAGAHTTTGPCGGGTGAAASDGAGPACESPCAAGSDSFAAQDSVSAEACDTRPDDGTVMSNQQRINYLEEQNSSDDTRQSDWRGTTEAHSSVMMGQAVRLRNSLWMEVL
eukprot:GHVQ01024936.1.p1 GENE.GHVQ01024936.1~~GHVQ01024936.1.p1  ORF type:complete len:691 (-),score=149.27 GHVQ01024936.1:440-2512(-)